jgi:hypothetical protein
VGSGGREVRVFNRTVAEAFPIGIDRGMNSRRAQRGPPPAQDMFKRMTQEYSRRQLLLG